MMLEFTRSPLNKNSRRLAPAVKRYLGNDLNHSHLIIPHDARKSSLESLKYQAGVLTTEAEAVLKNGPHGANVTRLVRHVVEVALGVRRLHVDRRVHHTGLDR